MIQRLTLPQLASYAAVDDLVGLDPDPRWGRACLHTRRYDGHSIASWHKQYAPAERIEIVRRAILEEAPWSPLLRVYLPKAYDSTVMRAVDMAVVADQARLFLLRPGLAIYAESVLTKVAIAFRRGVAMAQTVKNAYARMQRQPIASVIDIAAFFDSIPWPLLDQIIDDLPADDGIKNLLRRLVRVAVVERRSGRPVVRTLGIPQGLSISPVLANLVLAKFDKEAAHALSGLGGGMRRYCDDMLTLVPAGASGRGAVQLVGERLRRLGFSMKPGTGAVVDTRIEPITWLGISLGPRGLQVPQATIEAKAAQLQAKLAQGILSPLGVKDALYGLEKHYGRILAPGMSQEVIRSIKERLDFLGVPQHRKVGIEQLQVLVSGQRHVEPPSGTTLWGQPSHEEVQASFRGLLVPPNGEPGRIV